MLELTVLAVPGCPHEPVLRERLTEVLAEHPDVRVVHGVVHDEADAARLGMRGSPTLLVNGVDPFAAPGVPVSVSCRIYRDETGWPGGAPSVTMLRQALAQAGEVRAPVMLPDPASVFHVRDRRARHCSDARQECDDPLDRARHRRTDHRAGPGGQGPGGVEPAAAMVFSGRRSDCEPCTQPELPAGASVPSVAANVCCGYINFFATAEKAARWVGAHPEVAGQVRSRKDALKAGVQIFGSLLSTS